MGYWEPVLLCVCCDVLNPRHLKASGASAIVWAAMRERSAVPKHPARPVASATECDVLNPGSSAIPRKALVGFVVCVENDSGWNEIVATCAVGAAEVGQSVITTSAWGMGFGLP
jgi:hypothetical protein